MKTIIAKFGGTSVANAERISALKDIIKARITTNQNENLVIVVSALSGVTDALLSVGRLAAKCNSNQSEKYKSALKEIEHKHLDCINELIPAARQAALLLKLKLWFNDLEKVLNGVSLVGEASIRCLDYVSSFGELLSAAIIAESFKASNIQANFLDARELIKTDENFGNANVNLDVSYRLISDYFSKIFSQTCELQIVTGFIAKTTSGDTITLGRGGSDYTAAIFAAALNADLCEIWTDVDGIMTADPRKVKKAFPQAQVSYEEAMELSHFGAKVIYPPTMRPALAKQIPIVVKNTFNPSYPGTLISMRAEEKRTLVTGISSISEVSLLRIQGPGMVGVAGVSARLFSALAKAKINVILITQASSEHTICVAISPTDSSKAISAIEAEFSAELLAKIINPTIIEEDLSIVSVVGEGMRQIPGVAGKVFSALGKHGINIVAIAQGSSELNISAVIKKKKEIAALNALHEEFFFADTKTINCFICGIGLIGKTLLEQIIQQKDFLSKTKQHQINVIGVCNSKKVISSIDGLSDLEINNFLTEAKSNQESSADQNNSANKTQSSLAQLKNLIYQFELPNSVFVDCSASEEVIKSYPELLSNNISIVTPNKKAQTAELNFYSSLKNLSKKKSVRFLYETSVGAGLPVINTLNDLLISGDQVEKIEAVLSGTLSFIFNNFNSQNKFSDTVKKAKELGFTEPDPRDDLNGLDVARKILILARECGSSLELKDVKIESLLSNECLAAKSVEDFFKELEKLDSHFENLSKAAEKENQRLRFVASYENSQAQISLKKVPFSHPFYNLSGSDNIISFTTRRYREYPLVIKGPGAGAQVTAAGVFADIIRIAS